ncbi:MAG: BTAD domain-containing putative transcriptional regulator, partial [Anaerolineae bacterium]
MNLLSEVKFWVDGKTIPSLRSRTATALLIYLAYNPQSFSRDFLATFFWPDKGQEHAAANLRSTLRLLRPKFQSNLTITRKEVTFNQTSPFTIDALELEKTLDNFLASSNTAQINPDLRQRLPLLLATDQAVFMPGFHLSNSPKFEHWLSGYRDRLQQKIEHTVQKMVRSSVRAGEYQTALASAKRLVELDPYNEALQRLLMEIQWRTGKKSEALRQYKTLAALLKSELDIVPSEETLLLHARIRSHKSRPPSHLPPQTTPFIGRDTELLALFNQLMDPTCRLLTILGPGGIGKTRLLIALGEMLCGRFPGPFPDGIFYIPLVQLSSANYLATALITGLGLAISGDASPQEELVNHVKGKELAILLDNMEHLLTESAAADTGVQLIEALIHASPGLKIVVTSRTKISLTQEWVFGLDGLRLPPKSWQWDIEQESDETRPIELAQTYPATDFFIKNGRRINTRFNLNLFELLIISDICHLLDGFPLGIEMASALLDHLTPAEIKEQIIFESSNLASPMRNTPDRHRSLWRVFAYSYQRLSMAEKASFCQLAIFNSRFDVGAAQTVAIASEAILDLLVNHSLLKVIPTDEGLTKRYEMHRLLRQFALEQLVIEHELKDALETRYIDYFIDFLDIRGEGLRQGGPTSLFTEVEAYIDDIRGVWQRLIPILTDSANDRWIKAETALEALCNFYFAKGWIAEGLELVEKLASLDHGSTFSLRSALWQAEFEAGLGNYPTADSAFKHVLSRSHETGSRLVELEALNGLGRVKYLQGDMETAEKLFQEGLDLARYEEDPISISL